MTDWDEVEYLDIDNPDSLVREIENDLRKLERLLVGLGWAADDNVNNNILIKEAAKISIAYGEIGDKIDEMNDMILHDIDNDDDDDNATKVDLE